MASSRTASVDIFIEGANAAINVADHLINLTYEESIRDKGFSLKMTFADPELLFLNSYYVQTGSQIRAVINTNDWDSSGTQLPPLDCGLMWVDTIDMDTGRKGSVVTLCATAISPDMLRRELHNTGTEGTSQSGQLGTVVKADGQKLVNDSTANAQPQRRRDQDWESDFAFHAERAHQLGDQVHAYNGQVVETNEQKLEDQAPVLFLQKDLYPTMSLKYKFTNIGCYAGSRNLWSDTLTGKTLDNSVLAPNPIPGAKSMLNTHKRPPLTGQDNEGVPYPDDAAIGKGAPGSEGATKPGQEYLAGPGFNPDNTDSSPGQFLT